MPIAFDTDFAPLHGALVELRPGVRRLVARNPGPLTFRGTNTYVVGTGPLVVIDPGPDDPDQLAEIRSLFAGEKVTHVLVTHAHRDHAGAARAFAARHDAPVLAAGAGASPQDPANHPGFVPDLRLADGDRIATPAGDFEVIATPGHTGDHLAFALAGEDLLFTGDHVMGWSSTVVIPPDGAMDAYLASLDRVIARPETLYLPGHGGPVPNGPVFAAALRRHRLEREAAILARLAAGDRTVPELVRAIYGAPEPAIARAAALSVLAHLQRLVMRRRARVEGPPTLDARYAPA